MSTSQEEPVMDNPYMDERAHQFGQTLGSRFCLVPAVLRQLKKVKRGATVLDVACGQGILYPHIKSYGLSYVGTDISRYQIKIAQKNNPGGEFHECDARKLGEMFSPNSFFDVIIINMLLPSLRSQRNMTEVLTTSCSFMARESTLLLGVAQPHFDQYMQHGVLNTNPNLETEFNGYFEEGARYILNHYPTALGAFTFTLYHWTQQTYTRCIKESGLWIDEIDDCPPSKEAQHLIDFWNQRNTFPTYQLFICKKR